MKDEITDQIYKSNKSFETTIEKSNKILESKIDNMINLNN